MSTKHAAGTGVPVGRHGGTGVVVAALVIRSTRRRPRGAVSRVRRRHHGRQRRLT